MSGLGIGEDADGQVLAVFVRGDDDLERVRSELPAELDGHRIDVRREIRVFHSGI